MLHYQMNVQSIDDISCIIEAAQETMNATEKDFEAIRSKKWYKRLWETVTFSKDNQIKMAKGVSSLSKLQEIMIRLLVVLSQNSTEISNAVKQNSDLINRLSITDALLSRQIDKIKFGGTSQLDFSDLSREKKVLIASLLIMADPTAQRNEYSRQYISSVLQAANITSFDNTVKIDAVDSLGREEQELLYRMIIIDRHLMDIDFDEPCEVIEWISVKPKRKKEIEYSIKDTASAVSPEFFATYYEKTSEIFDEVGDDGIWFGDFEDLDEMHEAGNNEESVNPIEYEDMTLSGILHIPQGEIYQFENKNLHVQSIIDCEGILKFRNCTIHYGENDQLCEIKVKESGYITMEDCTIEGHSSSEQFFIKVDANCGITELLNCQFLNCSCFMYVCNAFLLQRCYIKNAGGKFIESHSWNEAGTIKNTTFEDEDLPDFILHSRARYQERVVSCRNLIIESSSFTGTLQISTAEEADTESKKNSSFYFIDSDNLKITNSLFTGVENTLYCNGTLQNCTFKECGNIIRSKGYSESVEIIECTFEKCTCIGSGLNKGSKISHCKFNNCFNRLLASEFNGGVQIDCCEFNYCTAKREEISKTAKEHLSMYYHLYNNAMLTFHRSKGSDSRTSYVTNCIFNGVSTHHFYLIDGTVHNWIDGYVVSIENCSFSNCTTERFNGRIIKEYDHYFGLFNKQKEIKTVSIASSCRGLDQVRKV